DAEAVPVHDVRPQEHREQEEREAAEPGEVPPPGPHVPAYPVAANVPRTSTVTVRSTSSSAVHVNSPPMSSGRAGVIVTVHSPLTELNSRTPSGPWILSESPWSAEV